jgi:hypothetical protein
MYIYGASGQARVIIDMIDTRETVHGVFDDNPELEEVLGYPVQNGIPPHFEFDQAFFIAIGENKARKHISQKLDGRARFATIIHPSAIVSKRCRIGEGSVDYGGCHCQGQL